MRKIPKTISTTQLQRKPKLLAEYSEQGEEVMVLRDSEILGVFTPVEAYNSMVGKIRELEEEIALKEIEEAEREIAEKGVEGLMTMEELFEEMGWKKK